MYRASHGSEVALNIWDYMTYGPWPDVDAYTATIRAQSASFDPVFYAILSNESGRACGQASFLDIHAQNGVTEIGHIWFGPELQRTRGATEALFLMLVNAMDDQGYRRMQWRCNALNAKSRSAARRPGFRFEGIFYNNMIFKGKNRDAAWYSILDHEWPEIRENIGNWLEPSNFNSDGRAKTSLSRIMGDRSPGKRCMDQVQNTGFDLTDLSTSYYKSGKLPSDICTPNHNLYWYFRMKKSLLVALSLACSMPVFAGSNFDEELAKAGQGDVTAQLNLGLIYYNGEGVQQNYKQAAGWYRKAAELGDGDAQYNLGYMYEKGTGVPQDYKQSVAWYRKAAEQGNVIAQLNLGVMYANGKGVPQDYAECYAWNSIAAAYGNEIAKGNTDRCARKLSHEALTRAQDKANEYWEKFGN